MSFRSLLRTIVRRKKTDSAVQDTVVDNFENSELSEYSGSTEAYKLVDSSVIHIPDGSYALCHSSGSTDKMTSNSGLPTYPESGDTFCTRFQWGSVGGGPHRLKWATQRGVNTSDGYHIEINESVIDSELKLVVRDGTNSELAATNDIGWTAGQWYDIEVSWGIDGSIAVSVYDSTGSQQGTTISAIDETYSSGGIGFQNDGIATVYWDYIRITSTGQGMAETTGLYSSWTKDDANNPVFSPNSFGWDNDDVLDPAIVEHDGTYHMIYRGDDGSTYRIGHATSPDLINWTRDEANNPILDVESGTWESTHLRGGTELLVDEHGTAHAFYRGYNGSTYQIGHATSDNFSTWKKDPSNPVFSPSRYGWRSSDVMEASIIEYDGTYHALVNAYNGSMHQIGHATSTNLSDWTWNKDNNPVLSPSESYDSNGVRMPTLTYVDGTFELIYNAVGDATRKTAYASSNDLINWVKDSNNPVLTPDSEFDEVAIRGTGLVYNGTDWVMLYTGEDRNSHFEIGKADAQ